MNRHVLTGVVISVCLYCVTTNSYACFPLVIDVDSVEYTPVDVKVDVDAWVEEGGPVCFYGWYWFFERGLSYDSPYQGDEYSDVAVWASSPGWYDVFVYAENIYGYYSDFEDCDVCVFAADIQDDLNRDTAEYIAYQTGTTIYYNIEPASPIWYPYSVMLYIKDGATKIRTENITNNGIGEKSFDWDGKKDNEDWAEPKPYTAEI